METKSEVYDRQQAEKQAEKGRSIMSIGNANVAMVHAAVMHLYLLFVRCCELTLDNVTPDKIREKISLAGDAGKEAWDAIVWGTATTDKARGVNWSRMLGIAHSTLRNANTPLLIELKAVALDILARDLKGYVKTLPKNNASANVAAWSITLSGKADDIQSAKMELTKKGFPSLAIAENIVTEKSAKRVKEAKPENVTLSKATALLTSEEKKSEEKA